MEKVASVKSPPQESNSVDDIQLPASVRSKMSSSQLPNKAASQRSRIPTREKSMIGKMVPPSEKRFTLKKKSKTSIDFSAPISQLSSNTARPSTSSRFTINSNTSNATISSPRHHRLGELPSYLKKGEKHVTETMLNTKKKSFNILKKRVEELQTDLLSNYKTLHEMQNKFNKSTGVEENLEGIKLITVIMNDVEEMLIKKEDGTLKSTRRSLSPLRIAKDSRKLDDIKIKLKDIGSSCQTLCQQFFFDLTKFPAETLATGDTSESKEIVKNIEPTARKIRDEINVFMGVLGELEEISSSFCNLDPKLVKSYEEKLEQLVKLSEEKQPNISKDGELKHVESDTVRALKMQITDKQVILAERDKEITELKEMIKFIESQKSQAEKEIQNIRHDMNTKSFTLKKLENEIEVYKGRSKHNEVIMDEVNKQKTNIVDLTKREQETKRQYDKERDLRLKLEKELIERENRIEKLKSDLEQQKLCTKLGGGDRPVSEKERLAEIENMRAKLDKVVLEKTTIENEKNELKKTLNDFNKENVRIDLIKANDEIKHLNTTNNCLRDVITKLEQSMSKKQEQISDLERKITNGIYLTNTSKELQNELANLRELKEEKNREIENYKLELSKARIEIKQQEETIYMHQRLLRIRSELINSLQEKEAANRCHMDDLYSEITKKASLVNQMNHEMSAKAEELQNLFSTLGTKQMELTRQEHIIKMLEENNDRNQRLRVKQEEKIARLESENSELKHVLSSIDSLRPKTEKHSKRSLGHNNEYELLDSQKPSKDGDFISTREIYDTERRRKRNIEIEVKKIHV